MDTASKAEIKLITQEITNSSIDYHASNCPFKTQDITGRVRNLELSLAKLIGFMFGSGLLGGTAGAALIKFLS